MQLKQYDLLETILVQCQISARIGDIDIRNKQEAGTQHQQIYTTLS